MAVSLIRSPLVRALLGLVALITLLHYSLSYSSPNYIDQIPFAAGLRQKAENAAAQLLENAKSLKDFESSDWSSRITGGKHSEVAGGKRANAVFVILVRNQVRLVPLRIDLNRQDST